MGESKLCYRCMEMYESYKNVCPHCGYDERTPYNTVYIAPGTILHDRYTVGLLIGFNGEGATYIAYDQTIGCKVLIREYMPVNLCTRVTNKPIISVNYNNLAKYKAFMAEYTELNKSLARFRNNTNIISAVDMFAENNTTYTVFEYVEGIKLLDYLKDNAGELSWEQVSKLFPPLFTTIGIIHNAGITHRAISPETVYVTDKGELKLLGFCISAIRTVNTGLDCEIYKGYAAPEQYSASTSSRQGSWTDVYGICALLYRVLTGCMPTEASSRMDNDNLCEPSALNKNIPQHVSRVIMEGLNISGRDRIQTITELVTKLFEQPAEIKPVYATGTIHKESYSETNYVNNGNYNQQNDEYDDYYDDDDIYDDNESGYEYQKVSTIDRFKIPIIIGVLLLAILMVIVVAILNVISPGDGDSSNNSYLSTPDNIIEGSTGIETTTELLDGTMLDLKGKYFDITQQKYADSFTLEATYEFNNEYENGQIFEQDIAAGEPYKSGSTTVKVKVSKGPSEAEVPAYDNYTVAQYEAMLNELGIKYQLVEDTSGYGTANTVTRVEINGNIANAGDKIKIESGEKLMVYFVVKDVIVTAAPTEQPTTEPPTEAPTEPPTEAPTEPPVVVTEPPTEAPTDAPEVQEPENSDGGEAGGNEVVANYNFQFVTPETEYLGYENI